MGKEKTLLRAVVGFLVKDKKILLAKKTQKIGAGCYNGYGGGIENGETPDQAMLRELHEEAGIRGMGIEKVAIIDVHNTRTTGKISVCTLYAYLVKEWYGEPRTGTEMLNPKWFSFDQLPKTKMMPGDGEWLPMVLGGKKVRGEVHYGPFQKKLLKPVCVEKVTSLSQD